MKVKESILQQQENEFKKSLSYEEWLRDNKSILDGDDLSNMEKSLANNKNYKKEV